MNSPIVAQVFRQLFRYPACQSRQHLVALSAPLQHGRRVHRQQQARHMATRPARGSRAKDKAAAWARRTSLPSEEESRELQTYPMVTANDLRARTTRPTKVRMLMRDFIEDSLYNPSYGYFSKQAVIFTPGEPFDFPSFRDEPAFHAEYARRYVEFEDELDAKLDVPNETRQLWHTPTELFRPYYGEAIARYLLSNYMMGTYPYSDLVVYEMGAGRGTLMLNIMDYIRQERPEAYERVKYKIIEISSSLAELQNEQLMATAASRGHADKVEIINRSVFDWTEPVRVPCFVIALEVFDNFAHDAIRYDLETEEPFQALAVITGDNEMYELYEPALDPVAARYMRVRHAATGGNYAVPYSTNPLVRWVKQQRRTTTRDPQMPGQNLSEPEYIPTRLLQFFDILGKYFPAHRLLTSDFHALPNAIPGLNSPVVQTRYRRRTVPVRTALVHQGFFDILFPVDFRTMDATYKAITGKLTRTETHEEFMRNWAYLEDTEVQSGENPLLTWYKNASVLCAV